MKVEVLTRAGECGCGGIVIISSVVAIIFGSFTFGYIVSRDRYR